MSASDPKRTFDRTRSLSLGSFVLPLKGVERVRLCQQRVDEELRRPTRDREPYVLSPHGIRAGDAAAKSWIPRSHWLRPLHKIYCFARRPYQGRVTLETVKFEPDQR